MIYVDATELQVGSALGYAVAQQRTRVLDFVSAPWVRIEPVPGELDNVRFGVTYHPIVHRLDCPEEERS
jgi:hypothetical protein